MFIGIYSNFRDRLLRKYLQATATMLLPFNKNGINYKNQVHAELCLTNH